MCSVGALGVEGGYSFEWIAVLYIVGAYVRLYNPLDRSKALLIGCLCLCAMIGGWVPMLLQKVSAMHLPRLFEFGGYTSPFTVMIALSIFALCLKVRIASKKARKVVVLMSSTTLGIYLIHVQPVFFREVFGWIVQKPIAYEGGSYLCLLIILTAVIYIACTVLDFMRILLFSGVERFLPKRRFGKNVP